MDPVIDFQTDPSRYRHWRVDYEGPVATIYMDVDEDGGLFDGYQLKLNSYDLGVDIELNDIVQRLRFEHPEVKVAVLKSAKDGVFCAGANIRMLGKASHAHKVSFCKFTNETRNAYEAAEADSGQKYICAIQGSCAGGGYELALACNHIMLTDDRTSNVALPEVPLLGVLPGTGGLTRVTDKRKVRRDRADVFCSTEEGVKGQRALDWRLVDELVPNSKFDEIVAQRAAEFAQASTKECPKHGVSLGPLQRTFHDDGSISYSHLEVSVDRAVNRADILLKGPQRDAPPNAAAAAEQGDGFYLLTLAREFEDAILHLRMNERKAGVWTLRSQGDVTRAAHYDALMNTSASDWFINEVRQYWKRVLKRLDVTSRSLVALVEHGSCFVGVLAEVLFAVDRSFMMEDAFEGDNRAMASLTVTAGNLGAYPMGNGLSRPATRFIGDPDALERLQAHLDQPLEADDANALGLVTDILDEIDWDDEVRLVLEERASFSPDAMSGLEANLRFAGPETMETRIFGRLTAWQNWIFNRPNATGESGALQRYGTGRRGEFNMERV